MEYFKIKAESLEFCGFVSYGLMSLSSGASKDTFIELIEEEMYEYISGFVEEEESCESAITFEEVTVEEYSKEKRELFSSYSVFQTEDGSELIFSTF